MFGGNFQKFHTKLKRNFSSNRCKIGSLKNPQSKVERVCIKIKQKLFYAIMNNCYFSTPSLKISQTTLALHLHLHENIVRNTTLQVQLHRFLEIKLFEFFPIDIWFWNKNIINDLLHSTLSNL